MAAIMAAIMPTGPSFAPAGHPYSPIVAPLQSGRSNPVIQIERLAF